MTQAGYNVSAQWELAADAAIAAAMVIPDSSDTFNSPAEYRAYLRGQLEIQKQAAYTAWVSQAQAVIDQERQAFIEIAATRLNNSAGNESDDTIDVGRQTAASSAASDAQSFDELETSVVKQEVSWSKDFRETVTAGVNDFQTAIGAIEQQYDDFVRQIAERRAEFEGTLQQIEGFENNVREGIRLQLTDMENLIQSSGIYREETCDTEFVCTLDPGSTNAAGAQLQAFITSMRVGLDNGASLVDISNQMRTYLEASRSAAEASRTLWADRTSGTEALPVFGTALNGLTDPQVFSIPDVVAIDQYFGGYHGGVINMVRQRSGQPSYRSIAINSADAQAYTPPGLYPYLIPGIDLLYGNSEWYSQVGRPNIFTYDHQTLSFLDVVVHHIPEAELQFHINYTWHDPNAEVNRDRWAGYVGELDTMLARWNNEILPAAQTWDTQRATYEANFEAWKLDAATQQQAAFQATVQNRDVIVNARNQYIARTDSEYRQGQSAWRDIKQDIAEARSGAQNFDQAKVDIAQRLSGIAGVSPSDLADRLKGLSALPALSSEFLNRSSQDRPELENLATFQAGLSQSLLGARNQSVTNAIEIGYERERGNVRRMMVDMLKQNRLGDSTDADILVTLFMQRLESGQLERLNSLGYDELVRHMKSVTGLGESTDLTTTAVESFARMYGVEFDRPVTELISEERADAADAIWQVQELNDGKLRATRTIKSGNATLNRGADATLAQSYTAETEAQVLEIATQAYAKLPTARGLFDGWDLNEVLGEFEAGVAELYQVSKQQSVDIQAGLNASDRYRSAKDQQFEKARSNQVQFATIIQKAIISAMTGGSLMAGATGYVQGQILGPIAADLEKVTGIPAGIWSGLMGGSDLEGAMIGYGFGLVEEAFGMPGLSSFLGQQWGKAQARAAKHEAARFRPEDMAGITYAWRNAPHNKDGAVALQAVETVVFTVINAAGAITGIGAPLAAGITAGYYAAKQGYLGSLAGGSRGAVTGLLSGAVNGVLAYATKGAVNVGASYSYEEGFSASVGLSVPTGVAMGGGWQKPGQGLSLGVSASYNEFEGITGYGVSAGYNFFNNVGVGLSAGWSGDGQFTGGSASIGSQFTRPTGADRSGWNAGLNFNREQFTGVTAGITNSWDGGVDPLSSLRSGYSFNAGLGYNWVDDSWSLTTGQYATLTDSERHGFNSITSGANNTYTFGRGQELLANQTISTRIDVQSREAAAINAKNQKAYLEALRSTETDPWERAKLSARIDELKGQISVIENFEQERLAMIDKLVADDYLTPEQAQRLAANPDLAHEDREIAAAIALAGRSAESRWGLGEIFGSVKDGLAFLFGGASDKHGFIDPNDGEYTFRTCFVAGTLVRVKDGTGTKAGNYKRIEDIGVGDVVLSWDEMSGRTDWKPVREKFVREADRIYKIVLNNGETLETTWSHPFFVIGIGWVNAKDLKTTDSLVDSNGSPVLLKHLEVVDRSETVYNFSVEDNHTYFVGKTGILVHNADYYTDKWDQFTHFIKGISEAGLSEAGIKKSLDRGNQSALSRFQELNLTSSQITAEYREIINAAKTAALLTETDSLMSATMLEHFLDGEGKTVQMDVAFLRKSAQLLKTEEANLTLLAEKAQNELRSDPTAMQKLRNGEPVSINVATRGLVTFGGAGSSRDALFYASGDSTLTTSATVTFQLGRDGEITFQALADHSWVDRYDWHADKQVYIPGYGRVPDAAALRLSEEGLAHDFDMKAGWKQEVFGRIGEGAPVVYSTDTVIVKKIEHSVNYGSGCYIRVAFCGTTNE